MSIIHESPDGGDTVYARQSGSSDRTLIYESESAIQKRDQLRKKQLWHDILLAANDNPTLAHAITEIEFMYILTK